MKLWLQEKVSEQCSQRWCG